jgi:hypothetical protein
VFLIVFPNYASRAHSESTFGGSATLKPDFSDSIYDHYGTRSFQEIRSRDDQQYSEERDRRSLRDSDSCSDLCLLDDEY